MIRRYCDNCKEETCNLLSSNGEPTTLGITNNNKIKIEMYLDSNLKELCTDCWIDFTEEILENYIYIGS